MKESKPIKTYSNKKMLELLELAGGRLTATGLERLLANPALQQQQLAILRQHSAQLLRNSTKPQLSLPLFRNMFQHLFP